MKSIQAGDDSSVTAQYTYKRTIQEWSIVSGGVPFATQPSFDFVTGIDDEHQLDPPGRGH
jgi:hypothetical protein